MRILTLATAVFVLAAPAMSMANAGGNSTDVAGQTNITPLVQLNPGANKLNEAGSLPLARFWRCPRRRGYKVTHMTFPRHRTPVCHYSRIRHYRVSYNGRGWRVTRNAWRHCRRKYGRRVIRALESRTRYRCIFRR
jgi:hypothetical protein